MEGINGSAEYEDSPNSSSSAAVESKPLCRYFASNMCYRGESCPFSHDRNAKPDMVCKFYLAGNCSYGSACRYDHVRPKILANNNPSSTVVSSFSAGRPSSSQDSQQQKQVQQPKSSRFSTLPSLGDEEPKQPGKSNQDVRANSAVSFVPASSWSKVSAWDKPLQSSATFAMNTLSNELEGIEGNSFTPLFVENEEFVPQLPLEDIPLCPYHETSTCINGDMCIFVHGNLCEMCGANVLHPYNEELAKQHHRECLAEHEKAMEEAFAGARSLNKRCGICMEMIVEKKLRFGILQNCKHCFCLNCIREWRSRSEQYETKTVRSCPECRVHSDYIIPSASWVEETEEKDRVIAQYRENMKQKQCKYMKSGQVDDCPFGNKCFYKHQLPDGTMAEAESPRALRRQRRFVLNLHQELLEDSDDETLMNEVVRSIMSSLAERSNRQES